MIVARLEGGLGNQMFQYASGKYLSMKHQTELFLDRTFLQEHGGDQNFVKRNYDLDVFELEVPSFKEDMQSFPHTYVSPRSRLLRNLCKKGLLKQRFSPFSRIRQNQILHDTSLDLIPNNSYLMEGTWSKLFILENIREVLLQDFRLKVEQTPAFNELKEKIAGFESVCLNVRRGDFVELKSTNALHGVCTNQYFMDAVNYMKHQLSNPHFFIFSDDIDWCRKELGLIENNTIVDHDYAGPKFKNYLQLMIDCKHFIIPNSTFGFWAAWLNRSDQKIVIAPNYWLLGKKYRGIDLIPNNWLRMEAFNN